MSDLADLRRDLGKVPATINTLARKALEVTAFKAKDIWRDHSLSVSGARTRGYAYSVDYDVKASGGGLQAEIGPNLSHRQGSFGIFEDRPGGVHGPPQKARPKVLQEIAPDFEQGLDKAVDDALRRAGL